ncbi:MAG: hypothetical protein ACXAC5_00235 [Promethearchaeota archaeon]|jgi:hypothetical protein
MYLKLDPSSGFADSYFDIEFVVTFERTAKSVVTLYNDTSQEHLDIVGVSLGYIQEGNQAVIKGENQLRGHFNIFNDDKMNKKFALYSSVNIRCQVNHFNEDDESIGTEEETLIFYNESHSLDAEIIPFDLVVYDRVIDVENNEPLKIDIISGLPKKYELCIQSADFKSSCHIEISALKGRTTIEIPAALLAYDLELHTHGRKEFYIYYVKFQGTNLSRLANRKYYRIENTELTFTYKKGLSLKPQSRLDPAGRLFSRKFVVSDRYLVLCPREYSGFARKSEFSPEKLMDLTMLVHEGQHMENLAKEMQQFAADDSAKKIEQTQKKVQRTRQQRIRPRISTNQIQLMRSVSGAYETVLNRPEKTPTEAPQSRKVAAFSTSGPKEKKGCLPCTRKRRNA